MCVPSAITRGLIRLVRQRWLAGWQKAAGCFCLITAQINALCYAARPAIDRKLGGKLATGSLAAARSVLNRFQASFYMVITALSTWLLICIGLILCYILRSMKIVCANYFQTIFYNFAIRASIFHGKAEKFTALGGKIIQLITNPLRWVGGCFLEC